jgi:non-specific serine/threonine protein kinase
MPESGKGEAEVSSPATVRPEKSIVVLPFTDLSPQKDQDYFCDGMTEEIITDLSHVHELLVISRSSAMTFKGSSKTVRDIAKDLNIRYALEGSVRKAGNGLRITAQLIDAMNDTHIWAEKYTGELDDVFDMQEQVSRSVVEALRINLSLGEAARISERPIDNIQAYDYYLRAKRIIFTSCTADGLRQALHDLEAGLAIMGDNVILNQGMAEVYLHHYEYGIRADEETLKRAEEYTNKVIGLKPDSAEGYYLLGRIERFRGTVIKATSYFKRALAVDPNHNSALFFMANGLGLHAGKASLAEPFLKRLQKIDPLTPLLIFLIGYIQWLDGKIDDALSTFQFMTTVAPELAWGRFMAAHIFAGQGKKDQVFKLADDLAQHCPEDQVSSWTVALKFALQGEKKKALDTFSEKAREFFWNDPEVPWFGASLFALLDEKSEALDWLEHAIDRGWINYPLFAERNPLFANIRGEERFIKLMERVKYEWEHFEVLP